MYIVPLGIGIHYLVIRQRKEDTKLKYLNSILTLLTMVVEVKPIAGPYTLGEGPHWDEGSQSLYFVDIDGCAICKYNTSSGTATKCAI
ncbi:hypothetical protein WDU94_005576, partial [Cyamophila willieti]